MPVKAVPKDDAPLKAARDFSIAKVGPELPLEPVKSTSRTPEKKAVYDNLTAVQTQEDYANWYVIAHYPNGTGAFKAYQKLIEGEWETPPGPFDIEPRKVADPGGTKRVHSELFALLLAIDPEG